MYRLLHTPYSVVYGLKVCNIINICWLKAKVKHPLEIFYLFTLIKIRFFSALIGVALCKSEFYFSDALFKFFLGAVLQYFKSFSDCFIEGYLKIIISLGRMTPKLILIFLKKWILNKDGHNWERFTRITNNNLEKPVQVFQDPQSNWWSSFKQF